MAFSNYFSKDFKFNFLIYMDILPVHLEFFQYSCDHPCRIILYSPKVYGIVWNKQPFKGPGRVRTGTKMRN